jgi:RluA family pseudouridine synthase
MYKIELDDIIELYFQDEEMNIFQQIKKSQQSSGIFQKDSIKDRILYEDEYILVMNKPAWMNVHPGDHKSEEASLIELVHDYLGSKYSTLTFKPSLVHRIDRDTSGCILIAKEKKTLESLLSELQWHKIEKIYHAIVGGIPKKSRDTLRDKLLRIENAQNESKVRIDPAGQTAITHYLKLTTFSRDGESLSLLECSIETGRMHQIRVHLASIQSPIIGDRSYGNSSLNSFFKRKFHIDRQLLHAKKLSFFHPVQKKVLTIEAPYEEDFIRILVDAY